MEHITVLTGNIAFGKGAQREQAEEKQNGKGQDSGAESGRGSLRGEIIQTTTGFLFYVHEVYTRKNGAMPFKSGTPKMGTPSGDAPSVYNLLHRIWDVKDGSEKKGQYSISPVGKLAEQ